MQTIQMTKSKYLIENFVKKIDWNDPDKFNDKMFKLLETNTISRKIYETVYNAVDQIYPKQVRNTGGNRKDVRTLGQLAIQFYVKTKQEKEVAKYWIKTHSKTHFGDVTGKCTGIDPSGKFRFFKSNFDIDEVKRPDYLLLPIKKLLEIKVNVCAWKATFKVTDIKHYIKVESYVLVAFYSFNHPICYILLSPEDLQKMLNESSIEERWEFGDRYCIQFYIKEQIINNRVVGKEKWQIHYWQKNNINHKISKNALDLEKFTKIYKY